MKRRLFKIFLNNIGSIGNITTVNNSSDSASIAVAGETTVYSKSFKLNHSQYFGIWYKATSATSTPALKIQLEESYTVPATEGSSSTLYVIGNGVPDINSTLADEIAHIKTVAPVPMMYGRLKITGNSGNPADTIFTAYLFLQDTAIG